MFDEGKEDRFDEKEGKEDRYDEKEDKGDGFDEKEDGFDEKEDKEAGFKKEGGFEKGCHSFCAFAAPKSRKLFISAFYLRNGNNTCPVARLKGIAPEMKANEASHIV